MNLETDLLAAIQAGDSPACLALLHGKSEAERAAVAARMQSAFDATHSFRFGRVTKKVPGLVLDETLDAPERAKRWRAGQIALLATTTRIEALRKYAWRSIPGDDELLAVVRDRRPGWLPAYAELVCEVAPPRWPVVRQMVREGLVPRPTSDAYVLGLVHAGPPAWIPPGGTAQPALFERDPELLDEEIWRVFEVEGNRDTSLTGAERFWRTTLLELERSGRLDRARMLDATLAALARDFAQHKAGFFSRLHEALAPSATELAARASRYLDLLGSRISPTVALATRVLERLTREGELDAASFVDVAPAARGARGATAALAVVTILDRIATERAELHERAREAAASYLEHDAAAVHDAVLTLLEREPPTPSLRELAGPLVPALAASRRARLAAWLGENERAESFEQVLVQDAPSTIAAVAVTPIVSTDELFDVVVHVLETPTDRLAVERMLDGISRLGAPLAGLPTGRVKTARKRADTLVARNAPGLGELVQAWLMGASTLPPLRYVDPDPGKRPWFRAFQRLRHEALLERVARGVVQPLWSLPTDATFFVAPCALVDRAKQGELDPADAVIALLRLSHA